MSTSTTTPRALLPRGRHQHDVGPGALIASAALALLITFSAMTFAPDLAHHGRAGYVLSGVVMTLVDVLYLVGLLALVTSGAVPRRGTWRIATGLAIAGSVGVVVAEVLLRVSFEAGTKAFSVVGPVQALGVIGLGVGVLRARRWSGWRRFTWVAQGLYVPVVLVPALAASGGQNLPALAGLHTLVLAAGIAFAIEQRLGEG